MGVSNADDAAGASFNLSRHLWGLDWAAILPWEFDGITVESGSFSKDAAPFIETHYAAIFGSSEESRFFAEPFAGAKTKFFEASDAFIFRDNGKTIGIYTANPQDWSTYYTRTAALLPEYRSRHLVSRFMEKIYEPLQKAGVNRVEGHVSPTNAPMVKLHMNLGYVATSMLNTDRWGTIILFTKYLNRESESVFERQYCGVVKRSKRG